MHSNTQNLPDGERERDGGRLGDCLDGGIREVSWDIGGPSDQEISIQGKLVCMRCQHRVLG